MEQIPDSSWQKRPWKGQKREGAKAGQAAGLNSHQGGQDKAWVEQKSFKTPILWCPKVHRDFWEHRLLAKLLSALAPTKQ